MANQEERLKICHNCPLRLSTMFGDICDNKRYLNIKNNQIRYIPTEGFQKGCGCNLEKRSNNPNQNCPLKKW